MLVEFTSEDNFGIVTVLDRVPGFFRCPVPHDVFRDGPRPRGLGRGTPVDGYFLSKIEEEICNRPIFFF